MGAPPVGRGPASSCPSMGSCGFTLHPFLLASLQHYSFLNFERPAWLRQESARLRQPCRAWKSETGASPPMALSSPCADRSGRRPKIDDSAGALPHLGAGSTGRTNRRQACSIFPRPRRRELPRCPIRTLNSVSSPVRPSLAPAGRQSEKRFATLAGGTDLIFAGIVVRGLLCLARAVALTQTSLRRTQTFAMAQTQIGGTRCLPNSRP